MIRNLWFKIFSIVLLVVLPLMAAQYLMQRESIELSFRVAEKNNPIETLTSHMNLLKELSKLHPENSEVYKKEFESTNESRNAIQDLNTVRANLIDDILIQTLRNTIFVLLFSLGITYWIARSIVKLLKRLVQDNQTQALRLERLGALESWQKVARMMVHEIRTPITPIKLVATDIESKFQSLDAPAFQKYLANGSGLIRSQIEVVERLIEGLTKFAKLPEVHKKSESISEFFKAFVESHRDFDSGRVHIEFESQAKQDQIKFDSALLNLLFFNLFKNAVEANPGQNIFVRIQVGQIGDQTEIRFMNSGAHIPVKIASEMFKPHVSSKGSHFGVGLTIAQKIAFDHKGELSLLSNDKEGVAFKLELPNI